MEIAKCEAYASGDTYRIQRGTVDRFGAKLQECGFKPVDIDKSKLPIETQRYYNIHNEIWTDGTHTVTFTVQVAGGFNLSYNIAVGLSNPGGSVCAFLDWDGKLSKIVRSSNNSVRQELTELLGV